MRKTEALGAILLTGAIFAPFLLTMNQDQIAICIPCGIAGLAIFIAGRFLR